MKKQNWYKLLYQLAIILILLFAFVRIIFTRYTPDFEAYCPFGGLQALSSFFVNDSLACSMTSTQIMMGIALLVGVVLFSRLFCGYICPLGTLSEWIGKLGEKLRIRLTPKGTADYVLRSLKYILLFATFYFTLKSSELFCKKFDPYYATVSGFNSDVVVLWASIAIMALFIGSLFVRLFWCRYLCPLGALSNIFRFVWFFVAVTGIYVIIVLMGVHLSYIYPLIVLSAGGYVLEITRMRRVSPSFVHITRNSGTCISCGLCSAKCPQGIDVASMDKVTHVDCTLCGDCLNECPEKDTLQINRKNMKWFPAAVLTILIAAGIAFASVIELPTINVKWGTAEQISKAEVYTRSGLKNIKCFGSSTAFANQMRRVNGVYGVTTFVGSHTVKIYYDPSVLNEDKIQRLLFVPEKRMIRNLPDNADSVSFYSMKVDQFFDPLDATYLQYLLAQKTEACGFQTEYGCPVVIRIYFPGTLPVSADKMKDIIETRKLSFTSGGNEFNVNLKYKVTEIDKSPEIISVNEYIRQMFTKYNSRFNNYKNFTPDVIKTYETGMGNNTSLKNKLSFLGSHLSNNKGIIGLQTELDTTGKEEIIISYVDTMVRPLDIYKMINVDSLSIHYTDGRSGKVRNPFSFPDKPEKMTTK